MLENNFQVIATGRNILIRNDIFAAEREKYKNNLAEINLNITSPSELKSIETYFNDRPLDVLINKAGFAVFGPPEECSEEKLRRQFEVNVFGMRLLTQKLLPSLRKAKGHIINFSIVFGFMGFPLSSAYCASKFAVEGFSESLSYELKPHSVKVTLIEPGAYRTNFNNAAEWGMTETLHTSVYHRQVANYTNLRSKLSKRPNPERPENVVHGVIRLIKSHNQKLNYSFGKDAFSIRFFKKVFTRSLFHRVSGRFLNKTFTKEH